MLRILARYTFRSEHDMRIGKQQDVSNLALALIALVIAGLTLASRVSATGPGGAANNIDNILTLGNLSIALPLVAALLSVLNLMILDHESNVVQIQTYITTRLVPILTLESKKPPQDWVMLRAIRQQGGGFGSIVSSALPSSKYALCVTSTLGCLVVTPFLIIKDTSASIILHASAWSLYSFALLLFIASAVAAAYTSILYLRLARLGS